MKAYGQLNFFDVYELIQQTELFDGNFYIRTNTDVADYNMDPLIHYLEHGASEGRNPSALFNAKFYLEQCEKLGEKPENPLLHFLTIGVTLGMKPLPVTEVLKESRAADWGLPLDPSLHYYIERLGLGGTLSMRGWIFHKRCDIANLVAFVRNKDGETKRQCKHGWPRADVHGIFQEFTHSLGSGFAVAGLKPLEESTFGLEVTFDDATSYEILVGTLQRKGEEWFVAPLTDRLAPQDDTSARSTLYERYADLDFVMSGSLGSAHARLAQKREILPPLPEPVVILVGVYGGRQYLEPFFESLFVNTTTPYHLLVVDDANSDPLIVTYLQALAASRLNLTLIVSPQNRGYVGAMSIALKHAPPGHLVTINTDTVVPPNWLERLVWPMVKDPKIASTTPITNAGTVCGFPQIGEDNPLYLGLDMGDIDDMLGRIRADTFEIELPTGVGFCMAFNRHIVDSIGWLDETAFGKGYGEENDWSLRAAAAGFRNILIPNLFVYHAHGGSFTSDQKRDLQARNLIVVNERYPGFKNTVDDFFYSDPIAPLRALAAFLLACEPTLHGCRVVIDHGVGGGANAYRQSLIDQLISTGAPIVLVEATAADRAPDVTLFAPDIKYKFPHSEWSDILRLLNDVRVAEVLVNNLVAYSSIESVIDGILKLVRTKNARLRIFVHDYFGLCPSLNLIDTHDRYCDLPAPEVCASCSQTNRHFLIDPDTRHGFNITRWRATMRRLFRAADEIRCFSNTSRELIRRGLALSSDRFVVTPHILRGFPARPIKLDFGGGLHIGVLGHINEAKGAHVVLSLVRAIAADSDKRASLTLFGSIIGAEAQAEVNTVGPYRRAELAEELEVHGVNLILIPSIWPETFCYTAEEAMALQIPVAVFDLGAPAERIRRYKRGIVLPKCDGEELLAALCKFFQDILEIT